ncbi:hypothetical protein H696_01960 [Fonticula alba]|uniref:Uncharacterized protein n=1 Tax=Fonticula alba TaxID=691883 RepID=A0A058Z9P5_FONAL|nr:hypothetical protein H696_01960 [Fonticula alba]KCV71014.1 hypothetical protein H696_01960 [Fonticula alba]|eukprot:XP_009494137.1 hypothetical protein H696_01960 [Fonticula alba]
MQSLCLLGHDAQVVGPLVPFTEWDSLSSECRTILRLVIGQISHPTTGDPGNSSELAHMYTHAPLGNAGSYLPTWTSSDWPHRDFYWRIGGNLQPPRRIAIANARRIAPITNYLAAASSTYMKLPQVVARVWRRRPIVPSWRDASDVFPFRVTYDLGTPRVPFCLVFFLAHILHVELLRCLNSASYAEEGNVMTAGAMNTVSLAHFLHTSYVLMDAWLAEFQLGFLQEAGPGSRGHETAALWSDLDVGQLASTHAGAPGQAVRFYASVAATPGAVSRLTTVLALDHFRAGGPAADLLATVLGVMSILGNRLTEAVTQAAGALMKAATGTADGDPAPYEAAAAALCAALNEAVGPAPTKRQLLLHVSRAGGRRTFVRLHKVFW